MRRPSGKVVGAVLIAVAVLIALLWWRGRGDEPRAPAHGAAAPAPAAAPAALAAVRPIALSAARASSAPDATSGALAGRVLDEATGAPVAGAEVAIAPDDDADGAGVSSFQSAADGTFEVRPPAPGRYRVVSALATGYLPWAPDQSPLVVVARAGQRVDGVVLYLVPTVDYQGLVLDASGAPVAGAQVVLLGAAAGEQAGAPIDDHFTSAADGTFTFHAPDNALLEARAGGAIGRARLDPLAETSHHLTIRLAAPGATPADLAIAGVVIDGSGAPVAGAHVSATHEGDGVDRDGEADSDGDGAFTIAALDPGAYHVRASLPGHAAAALQVDAGARDVRLVLGAPSRLTGRVLDGTGAPVPAATVAVLIADGVARRTVAVTTSFDAEGRFAIDDLPADDYLVVAVAHGWARSDETAATAPGDVTVHLHPGATLTGTMTDALSHAPLSGGKVTMEGALGDGSSAVPLESTAITGDDGSFTLGGIAPGRHSATAGAYQHNLAIVGPYEVPEGGTIGPVAVELSPVAPGETPHMELAGIGAALAADGETLVVQRVFPGSGAEAAGLATGDHVLAVDGAPVARLGMEGSIEHIRGPVGTQVVLTVQRGAAAASQVAVTRRKITA